MNAKEKRELLVTKALSRKEKNKYSQDLTKRTLIESGYGDCSGTVWYWYKKLFGVNIGANTEAQIKSDEGIEVDCKINGGVPEEKYLKKGDLLFFRGSDNSRTKGVGHVEMYIGDGKIFGHGSGMGGTVKDMKAYCTSRYNTASTKMLKNKGLICVKRYIWESVEEMDELTKVNDIVWELSYRGIITNTKLWLKKLDEDINAYWLARKMVHFLRINDV
ncbi:MAG: C40 family peptidase [Clostridia bacterium]|nr:C40 family peptidase [Clostridia bacterium]